MGKINLDNYEAFFLDYLEGNLAEDDRRELAVFLNMHPELKEELDLDLGELKLEADTESFEAKSELKASPSSLPITNENIEDLIIAHVEGQLPAGQDEKVLEYVHLHRLDRTLAAYEATILQSDSSERFENKEAIRSAVVTILTSEINSNNQEDFMISYHEDILTGSERMALEQYVRKNGLEKVLSAFGAVQLQPNAEEVFLAKSELKKPAGFIIPLYARVASVAAIGLLILGLAYDWNPDPVATDGIESTELAESEEDGSGELIENEKPIGVSDENNVIAYEEEVPEKENQDEPGIIPFPLDEQLISNNDPSPQINPIRKDSVQPKVILPNDLPEKEDDIQIVHVPQDEVEKDTGTVIIQPEDNFMMAAADLKEIKREEPAKVLTNLASDVFNREVAFTRDKDVASNEYVAYGFKLGKFEFQRKKAR